MVDDSHGLMVSKTEFRLRYVELYNIWNVEAKKTYFKCWNQKADGKLKLVETFWKLVEDSVGLWLLWNTRQG